VKEKVEKILADVFTRHSDRRLDVYKVQVESAGADEIKLTGRVLMPEALEETRGALCDVFPGVSINLSGVRVLRAAPGAIWTVASTLTDLHVEPSFLSEMYLQIPNGSPLEILDEHTDGKWCYVRMPDGYMGWAYKLYLEEGSAGSEPTHIVFSSSTLVCREPRKEVVTRLMTGTLIRVLEEKHDWSQVETFGKTTPKGWVDSAMLRDLKSRPKKPGDIRAQIVADARHLIGTYYLWGGNTPWGIDCSGLAQLTHRLAGYMLPRDADMQFRAATPVEAPYQAGDLFFFHSEANKNKIAHVGICTGGSHVIHSSRSRNGVYEEDMQASETLRNTFAGARIFVPR
jgi:cell wall-associated NlpC family hydrolase